MSDYSYEKKFDAVIVGAGVIGCSIAYFLARESQGKFKVGVIERNTVGEESSSGAAGMLAAQIECESGGPFLELSIRSRALFDWIAPELKEISNVDIEYVKSGIGSIAFNSEDEKEIKARLDWQKKDGLKCEWRTSQQLSKQFPFLASNSLGGFWVPEDGQVSAHRLTLAFSEAAKKLGVRFFENESFDRLALKEGKIDFLETNLSKFLAEKFIFAAGAWTGELLGKLAPVEPVKGQILIFGMPASWRKAHDWQSPLYVGKTAGPSPIHCYFVPKTDGHLLLGATSENRGLDKSISKIATDKMAEYACKIFPELASFPFKGVWAGLRPGSQDHLPILGLVPQFKNVYAASGHFRNGILLSPITGKLFAELFLEGRTSFPLDPFSPERFLKNGVV